MARYGMRRNRKHRRHSGVDDLGAARTRLGPIREVHLCALSPSTSSGRLRPHGWRGMPLSSAEQREPLHGPVQNPNRVQCGVSQDRPDVQSEVAERPDHQLIGRFLGSVPVLHGSNDMAMTPAAASRDRKGAITSFVPPRKCIHNANRRPGARLSGLAMRTGNSSTRRLHRFAPGPVVP
jgi:hypothetical protein